MTDDLLESAEVKDAVDAFVSAVFSMDRIEDQRDRWQSLAEIAELAAPHRGNRQSRHPTKRQRLAMEALARLLDNRNLGVWGFDDRLDLTKLSVDELKKKREKELGGQALIRAALSSAAEAARDKSKRPRHRPPNYAVTLYVERLAWAWHRRFGEFPTARNKQFIGLARVAMEHYVDAVFPDHKKQRIGQFKVRLLKMLTPERVRRVLESLKIKKSSATKN